MSYNIIRMPKTDEKLQDTLYRLGAFIDGMHSEHDVKWHGPMRFQLPHWLYLWDSGTGFFVEKSDDAGNTIALAMCTKFNDMWSGKTRLDIVKISLSADGAGSDEEEVSGIKDYLIGLQSMLQFDELYYSRSVDTGGEYKELLWQDQ